MSAEEGTEVGMIAGWLVKCVETRSMKDQVAMSEVVSERT